MNRILLVEDETLLRDAYTILLNSQNKYKLDTASNGNEALKLCKTKTYDLILLDLMMPILDGTGFLEKAKLNESSPKTRIVIMSNLSSGEGPARAMELGAHRHAIKSDLSPSEVLKIVEEELVVKK